MTTEDFERILKKGIDLGLKKTESPQRCFTLYVYDDDPDYELVKGYAMKKVDLEETK